MRTVLAGTALGLSVVGSAVLFFVSTGFGRTIAEVNGSWVVGLMMIPILISLVPLGFPGRPALIVATVLLWAFVVVGSFSIGLFYLPAAVALLLAASVKPRIGASQ